MNGALVRVEVAVPVPLGRAFTYEVPEALAAKVAVGSRVYCPFGGRRTLGVVLRVLPVGEDAGIEGARETVKPIFGLVDGPKVPDDLVAFLLVLGRYYFAPIGEVFRLALPPIEKKTAEALRAPSLFPEKVRGVVARTMTWIVATDASGEPRGPLAKALLAQVRARHEAPLPALAAVFSGAREKAKALAAQGFVRLEERERPAEAYFRDVVPRDEAPTLTDEQIVCVQSIDAALAAGKSASFLLWGVTGSGKTEVYLHALATAIAAKKGAIVLVPEIALTPQLVNRFRARFGDDVAVLHSGLTDAERHAMWKRLALGEVSVVIGARSALFAPVKNLGLVVVDEEHDGSFKQADGVRYNARDMALLRAHQQNAVVVLGSATPSIESMHRARDSKASGACTLLRMRGRATKATMPEVTTIDLRRIGAGPTGEKRLSVPLHRALEETLAKKEQAIIFLNRRGFAPHALCESCGQAIGCPHCSVGLTFHKRGNFPGGAGTNGILRCHLCDHHAPMPSACRSCASAALVLDGVGTEKLEEALAKAFPEARVARLDRDTGGGKKVEAVLTKMRNREIDILVGTQMVTKGHDLPEVTLVGVIQADAALALPDFRAAERTFQLLVQVAGRAGRGALPGKVLLQTFQPEHFVIRRAIRHDVDGFLDEELVNRRELGYPPFSHLALIALDDPEEGRLQVEAMRLADVARAFTPAVEVLGPTPAPLARWKGRYRWRFLLRAKDRGKLREALVAVHRASALAHRDTRVALDIDPSHLL